MRSDIHRKSRLRVRRRLVVLGSAIVGFSLSGMAWAAAPPVAQPTTQELLEKINNLQAEVTQLKTAQAQARDDTAVAAAAVVQDADQRSSLLNGPERLSIGYVSGYTGGAYTGAFGRGFSGPQRGGYTEGRLLIRSDDGNFLIHPWLQLQVRDATDFRDDARTFGRDDTQNGFEIRRLKFGLDGNAFTKDLTYFFQIAADRHTGTLATEQAWVQYRFAGTPFAIRAGQFKDPVDHEQLVSGKFTAAVDRTLVDDLFVNSEGFVEGVSALYDSGDSLHAQAAFTHGLRNAPANFQDFPTTTANWGAAARVDYKIFGNWSDYERLSAYGSQKDLLVVGAGADFTEAGRKGSLVYVADAQYGSTTGLGLYGSYLGRYTRANNAGPAVTNTYDSAVRAQVSYTLDQHWEPFLQYEFIDFDKAGLAAGTRNDVHVITAGTSYFLHGHAAKLQFDASFLPNGSPMNDDSFGILQDNGHNEFVLRAQFQLLL